MSAVKDSGAIVGGAVAVAVHSPREWSQESVDDSFDLRMIHSLLSRAQKAFGGSDEAERMTFRIY